MATYYTNPNNQRPDTVPMLYFREPLLASYSESPALPSNMMMYMNHGAYSDNYMGNIPSVGSSESTQHHQEVLAENGFNAWRGPNTNILNIGQNLQGGHGLSLTLSTQIPSGITMSSVPYRNESSRDEQFRNGEFVLPGYNLDSNKGDLSSQFGMSSTIVRAVPNSRYLKAAQQLLDEVVNVQKALKQPDNERNRLSHNAKDDDGGSRNESGLISANAGSSNLQESVSNSPCELSQAEKQDLQNKLTKLLSMLDEVDRRYKQYYHQMQIVVSSFESIAGCGAAKPYTSLALQTISRHFRCLRDAIIGQIKATRKSLGENDNPGINGVGIPRLRNVDQQLRQQKALQQLGMNMMQPHAWRPQRGLPESSVSILRAWLFEHFLHPYPKDSDKIMLARQTGLTRSQVSNWFINARVRLWKPMVEEMYKEEAGDVGVDSNSSTESAAKATRGDKRTFEDKGEDPRQSVSSTATERCSGGQLLDSIPNHVHDVEMAGCSTGLINFQNGSHGEARNEKNDSNFYPGSNVHPRGGTGNDRFMDANAAYHMSELENFGMRSQVSLTLGLQHREGSMYNAAASSVGETLDFECMNPGNQQPRFSSSHLYHDFVV